eukprot:scaffold7092_cov262-Pinguiococcus_pyrenoidosus.AAC.22
MIRRAKAAATAVQKAKRVDSVFGHPLHQRGIHRRRQRIAFHSLDDLGKVDGSAWTLSGSPRKHLAVADPRSQRDHFRAVEEHVVFAVLQALPSVLQVLLDLGNVGLELGDVMRVILDVAVQVAPAYVNAVDDVGQGVVELRLGGFRQALELPPRELFIAHVRLVEALA